LIIFFLYNSVVFFVLTVVINYTATTAIVITEFRTNEKFSAWLKSNVVLAISFTILAGVDVDVLDFLCSNFAEIKILNAPFSEPAQKRLKKIGILSIFYKDFPKLLIKVSDFLKLFF